MNSVHGGLIFSTRLSCHTDSIPTNPGRLASCSKQVPFLLPSLGDLVRTPLGGGHSAESWLDPTLLFTYYRNPVLSWA